MKMISFNHFDKMLKGQVIRPSRDARSRDLPSRFDRGREYSNKVHDRKDRDLKDYDRKSPLRFYDSKVNLFCYMFYLLLAQNSLTNKSLSYLMSQIHNLLQILYFYSITMIIIHF